MTKVHSCVGDETRLKFVTGPGQKTALRKEPPAEAQPGTKRHRRDPARRICKQARMRSATTRLIDAAIEPIACSREIGKGANPRE